MGRIFTLEAWRENRAHRIGRLIFVHHLLKSLWSSLFVQLGLFQVIEPNPQIHFLDELIVSGQRELQLVDSSQLK